MPGPGSQIGTSGPVLVLRVQAGQTGPSWWEAELTQARGWARPPENGGLCTQPSRRGREDSFRGERRAWRGWEMKPVGGSQSRSGGS